MGYIESLRGMIGNAPVILVRPSILILNKTGEILLVRHIDDTWGVPGGFMELGESVEEAAMREVHEEIGIELKKLELYGVFSGKELYTKLKNGHEYYNVVIGYICTEYEGELRPDGIEVLEAKFYKPTDLPDKTDPYLKRKILENAQYIASIIGRK
ncbi:NUDIX hydrolase [Paenibacillus xylanilyticus]|uniref:NUDIX domain-containing protein n=1 Tax=Paenibacillus xylanilyticus TaxID=248903 RepID=A0A7Y6BY66_9BACL|nr:NUDIX domain-containing protein [Paenibacillus xylanilyticus]NUU77117.1 NUDIX domain-containing protein [Paenibacillus xylanilyticus]